MLSLIRTSEYLRSKWKNGTGETSQIAIFPPLSSLEDLDFHFRISSAAIAGACQFSRFEGFDRKLAVINGSGLRLKHQNPGSEWQTLTPNGQVFEFSGNSSLDCEPVALKETVHDLGIIFNSQLVAVSMEFRNLTNADSHHELEIDLDARRLYVFAKVGAIKITTLAESILVNPGESAFVVNESAVGISLAPEFDICEYFVFRIRHKGV